MAARYFVAGSAGNNNWGQTGAGSNWSLTSGGAGGVAVPTAADDVFFDANSPATCNIATSNRVAKTVTTTGWTGTLTFAVTIKLSVSGNITLTSNTTITQAGADAIFEAITTSTITFGGCYIPVFGLRGAVTHTLADDGTVGMFYYGSTTNNVVVNGTGKITCTTLNMGLSSTGTLSGTAEIILGGGSPCYLNVPTSTGVLRNSLTFNTSSTVGFTFATFRYNTGTIKHLAGTVDASNCDLNIVASTTLDCGSAVTWKTINVTGTTTLTLTSDCYVSGLATLAGTTLTTTLTGSNLRCAGGLTINGTTGIITGTTVIVLTGTGTFTMATTTGLHACNLHIDAGSGTVTTSGTIRYPFNKIKYITGDVFTDAGTWASAAGTTEKSFAYVG